MSEPEFICATCGQVELNTHGRCEKCDSDNVSPLLATHNWKLEVSK